MYLNHFLGQAEQELSEPNMKCCHSFSFSSAITVATLLCDIISVSITTTVSSGPWTVIPTRRLGYQIPVVHRDYTQFSHPQLIYHRSVNAVSQSPQAPSHLKHTNYALVFC